MKRYKIVNKTRFYIFIVFIVYFSFSMFSIFESFSSAEDALGNNYEEVYVQPGDTVWSIALSRKPIKSDPRDMVAEIRNINELDDVIIKPGDLIKVPLIK